MEPFDHSSQTWGPRISSPPFTFCMLLYIISCNIKLSEHGVYCPSDCFSACKNDPKFRIFEIMDNRWLKVPEIHCSLWNRMKNDKTIWNFRTIQKLCTPFQIDYIGENINVKTTILLPGPFVTSFVELGMVWDIMMSLLSLAKQKYIWTERLFLFWAWRKSIVHAYSVPGLIGNGQSIHGMQFWSNPLPFPVTNIFKKVPRRMYNKVTSFSIKEKYLVL